MALPAARTLKTRLPLLADLPGPHRRLALRPRRRGGPPVAQSIRALADAAPQAVAGSRATTERLRNATLEHGTTGWAGAPGSSPSCRMLAGRRPAPLAPARASWPGSQCRPCVANHDLSLPSAGAVPSKGMAMRLLGSPGQVPRVSAQKRLLQARALRRIRMAPTHAQRKTPACNTLPQPCGSSAATRFHDTQACCPPRRTRATTPCT